MITPFQISPSLKRYPLRPRELLQAWDSADELILNRVGGLPLKDQRILILNDHFGAISLALAGLDVTTYTDSYVSSKAIELNSLGRVQPLSELGALTGKFALVLVRIPKNMSFFEDQLCHLSAHLAPGARVICGYMVKHQANSAFELLGKIIGPTRTSLAKKKARLVFAEFQGTVTPSPFPLQVSLDSFAIPFVNHSNLFSREKLDLGTRFFLEHLPQGDFRTILDLGCANGVIGIAAKRLNPTARIIFSDESKMAVLSAQTNYQNHFSDPALYHWLNCYEGPPPASVDLVLCNPPFHQGNTRGDFIAEQMFADALRALVPGGQLRVIGNSHLKYETVLQRIFGESERVAANSKFTIVDAFKNAL